jgi:hypothetical protein
MRSAFLFPVAASLAVGSLLVAGPGPSAWGQSPASTVARMPDFRSRLLAAATKHLDRLTDPETKAVSLKGKSADGMTAMAFYRVYELTRNPKYRAAAVALADRIVTEMKATKQGVLYIKEKDTGDGEAISGGGPPAFGWYTASAGYILHAEGGRGADVAYIASVIDNFPWNEEGWWANTIDIETGRPKVPLAKPGAINKNAAMAMGAGMLASRVRATDPVLASRLKAKADACIYRQIIPAQEADGYWHYGLQGTDPGGKDVLGYFMLTTHALIALRHATDSYQDPTFRSALDKACAFAMKQIAPMTDPNQGPAPPANRSTRGTPAHYTFPKDLKRGFELGVLLFASRCDAEGEKIIDRALEFFPYGNLGMDGAHAVDPSAMILSLLEREGAIAESKEE